MTTFDAMVEEFRRRNAADERNAIHEVMQQIALAGLSRGGFFERAAFYGGTCLRLLYDMRRFSEDMDFSLLKPDPEFRFEDYFAAVVEEFRLAGKEVEIKLKHKGRPSSIESAFLKESSDVYDIGFTNEKRLKIKIEVDIDPPPLFKTEMRTLLEPRSCLVRAYTLPDLFAGKASAALFRQWRNRIKGRDWHDIVWYICKRIPLNITHLVERARESGAGVDVSTPEKVIAAFDAKIDTIDFAAAAQDVRGFLMNDSEVDIDIWSRDFFHQMIHKLTFV